MVLGKEWPTMHASHRQEMVYTTRLNQAGNGLQCTPQTCRRWSILHALIRQGMAYNARLKQAGDGLYITRLNQGANDVHRIPHSLNSLTSINSH